MPWLQASIAVETALVPLVEDIFADLDAASITYEDAADQPLFELNPGETQLWQTTRCIGLFAAERQAEVHSGLTVKLPTSLLDTLKWQEVGERIWEREWLKNFAPKRFGSRLWVCPAGQRPEGLSTETSMDSQVIVDLDPGLAFGTGAHATTALCLTWLDALDLHGQHVLDYGCGSGILAIAAALLGAATVTAVDHDPQALDATTANALKNGAGDRLHVVFPAQCPKIQYDYVVANILANTLVILAPLLAKLVRPGGQIALSGIVDSQIAWVTAAYQDHFVMALPRYDQEWILLTGTRKDT